MYWTLAWALVASAAAPPPGPAGRAKPGEQPVAFVIEGADPGYSLRVGALLQVDSRLFVGSGAGDELIDQFVVRRGSLYFEGILFHRVRLQLIPEFGLGRVVILDAFAEYELSPALRLRLGKQRPHLAIELLQQTFRTLFIERGLTANLLPVRDLGLQILGEAWLFTYAVGAFNGVADGTLGDTDVDDGKELVARLLIHPFLHGPRWLSGLSLGGAASWGHKSGTPSSPELPRHRTFGQVSFFTPVPGSTPADSLVADGVHARWSLQASFHGGPLRALAELVESRQALRRASAFGQLRARAWQVAGGVVITGQAVTDRGYQQPTFDPARGRLGALELVGRYNQLVLGPEAFTAGFVDASTSPSAAYATGVGLTWALDRNVQLSVNFERTTFVGGAPGGNRPTERALLTRGQIVF